MSFVYLFLDHIWYITVLIILFGLDQVSSEPYLPEGKNYKRMWLWTGNEKELKIGEALLMLQNC